MIRNEDGLFPVLKKILKESADRPFTCTELYELPEVRRVASSANRVSDYLGNLWRDGDLLRLPAPASETSAARWAYQWKVRGERPQAPVTPVEYKAPIVYSDEDIVIETAHCTIIIRPKK